ncbi:MAG: diadenylate cyclase CdaA [Anaerolineae bacterium]|nr:diadenylate cyclase CdaA [Anaerolineae bacterium]
MEILWAFDNFNLISLLDILLVAALIYGASMLVRGTQAISLLRGMMVVLLAIGLLASVFQLVALRWLLNQIITGAVIAIPVIFQPELRRALTRLGTTNLFSRQQTQTDQQHIIEQICAASERLAERRHGALIVLERSVSLEEYINTGVRLDSEVTPQLLLTIFWPKTELHDGAAILTGSEIAAAACVLPLSSGHRITERKLGTRHRAALGISEVSDAICVVVSEETGHISVTNGGRMIRRLDSTRLRTILSAFYEDSRRSPRSRWVERLEQLRDRFLRNENDEE